MGAAVINIEPPGGEGPDRSGVAATPSGVPMPMAIGTGMATGRI
jgi:hypothetical protein